MDSLQILQVHHREYPEWYDSCTTLNRKALWGVVKTAQHITRTKLLVMEIPALFGEPDHLAQLSNKSQLFRFPNGFSFSTTSGFYNSPKFGNVLIYDYYVCTYSISLTVTCSQHITRSTKSHRDSFIPQAIRELHS